MNSIGTMLDLSPVESLLITGSNGFVGRSIINQISKINIEKLPKRITLLTRKGIDFNLPENLISRTSFITQDLSNEWEFTTNFSHVINLAADGSKSPYSPEANQTFTLIVENLAEWVSKAQIPPKLFHASSGACLGRVPIDPTKSDTNEKSSFSQNRINSENHLKSTANNLGLQLVIGRLYTFSGSFLLEKGQYAITDFIKSAVRGEDVRVSGDPRTVRSYLHQDAMAHWILTSLICETSGDTLQIGSQEAVTIGELAEFIAENQGVRVSYANNPIPGDIYLPNNLETRTKLGVSEGASWKLAVKEMINALRMDSYD